MDKIKDIKNQKPINSIEIPSNSDKTFNKLKELQILLKKESALKELCKKHFFNFL